MKKLFALALVLGLMVMASAGALAAVHNFTGDFTNYFLGENTRQFSGLSWGGWYSIDKDSAGITGRVLLPEDQTHFGFEYYQNDHFFVDLSNFSGDYIDEGTSLQASYLFDFGLFVGLNYSNVDDYTSTVVSPGYRYAFGDKGYAALSVDFESNDEAWGDTGVVDYDIDFKYFTGKAKIYGQVLIPNEDVTGYDQTTFDFAINYKINDNYTVGFAYLSDGNHDNMNDDITYFNVGVTASFDKFLAELRYQSLDTKCNGDEDTNQTDFNLLYSFTDKITAGVQVSSVKDVDDPYLFAKFKYNIDDKNSIRLIYQFENDDAGDDGVTYLRWDMAL